MRTVILRRGLVALFAAAVSFGAITQAQAETLRIGYQKYGTLVLLMGVSGAFLTGDLFNLYVWFEKPPAPWPWPRPLMISW